MKGRRSLWLIGLCALGLAFSTAAIGCGDDDDTDEGGTGGGGSGGSTAGKGGSTAGKGGSTAGKGGSGGGPSPAMCKTATADLMKSSSGALSTECISCICDANAKAITDCNSNAMCWPLIECVATKCAGQEAASCAPAMCSTTLGGAGPAMAAGMVIQGSACSAKCVGGDDAGTNDAGL